MRRSAVALLAAAAAACAPVPPPDRQAGTRVFQQCYSCHSIEPGENNLPGPTLYAIVGRRIAAEPRFDYSPALKAFAAREPVWTRALLDSFVTDPEAVVPGTSMSYHGLRDVAERKALLDHLAQTNLSADNLP